MIESRPRLDLYTGWIPNSDFIPLRRHYPETSLVNAWTKLAEAALRSGTNGYKAPAAAVFDIWSTAVFDIWSMSRDQYAGTFARDFLCRSLVTATSIPSRPFPSPREKYIYV